MEADSKTVIEIIEKLPEGVKSKVMSTLDIFIEKGKAEGKAEKTYQACCNPIRLSFDNDTICRVLEVDEAYVERMREELLQEESGEGEV